MALQLRAPATPSPISFAPFQAWEGNDGPWSTFAIRVGSPEQVFHVLISTARQETWIPVPEGCLPSDPTDCGAQRGALPFQNQPSRGFQTNASSTWSPINPFSLALDSELNYTGNGMYGYDTVGLQLPQSGGVSLSHQVVAGIARKDFYLGVFGLGPKPTNFTTFDNPQGSFLWSLKNQSLIPSLSWGYTAGAPYRLKKVPGSLTLGGYDSSRFVANNLTFPFGADDSKPLTLALKAIQGRNTWLGTTSLLPSGILTFIDSTVPEIWLPPAACQIFETAFALIYDTTTDRYLVNDSIHTALHQLNPVLSFILGNSVDGVMNMAIDIPYKAFDLQAMYPIYPNATNYFPLRRALNASQYILGRTFLQEAYVIADYERSVFSVSQCSFNENNEEKIVPIRSPLAKNSPLRKTTIIAIAVAAFVVTAITITMLIFWFYLRRRHQATNHNKASDERDARSSDSVLEKMPFEVSADVNLRHLEVAGAKQDMARELVVEESATELSNAKAYELSAETPQHEMTGSDRDMAHELTDLSLVEVPAGEMRHEMAGVNGDTLYELAADGVDREASPTPAENER